MRNLVVDFVEKCRQIQEELRDVFSVIPPSFLFEAQKFCHEAMTQRVLHLSCTSAKHLDFEWFWQTPYEGVIYPASSRIGVRFFYVLRELAGDKPTTLNHGAIDLDDGLFADKLLLCLVDAGIKNLTEQALANLINEAEETLGEFSGKLSALVGKMIESKTYKMIDVEHLFRVAFNGKTKARKLSNLLNCCRKEMFLVRDSLSNTVLSLERTKSIFTSKTIADIRQRAQRSLDHLCEFLDRLGKV